MAVANITDIKKQTDLRAGVADNWAPRVFIVTPHDTQFIPYRLYGIEADADITVAVINDVGDPINLTLLKGVPKWVVITRVLAAGTGAGNILGYY